MEARDIIKRARTQLVIHRPFFGHCALMLEVEARNDIPTMATDGKSLYYNEEFVGKLSASRLETAICHEILHVAMAHTARFGNRDTGLWKLATDYAINPMLKDCGFDVSWLLYEQDWHGLDADTIYMKLLEKSGKKDDDSGGNGNGDCDGDHEGHSPNGFESQDGCEACGGLESGASNEAERKSQEQAVRSMVARASTIAKLQGNLPGALERMVDGMMKPKVDWRAQLRHFMERAAKNDYSWDRPNRRHLPRGFYLPTLYNMEMGEVVVAIDTSASVSPPELESFLSEVSGIMEQVSPERVYIVYCDSKVAKVDEYTSDELPLRAKPAGGGGTDFRPPFHWVEQYGIEPQCLVYLTDMACNRYPEAPDYPVLWVSSVGEHTAFGDPPFGEVVSLTNQS